MNRRYFVGWTLAALMLIVLASGCAQVVEVRVLGTPTWAPPTITVSPLTPDVAATVQAAVGGTKTAEARTPQIVPTSTSTVAPTPTATPVPPTATPTRRPPTATPTPWPQPIRIYFAKGETSDTVSGSLPRDGYELYVLRALAAQTMYVAVNSPAGGVTYSVWGADGTVLKAYSPEVAEWSGQLPSTQDYFVHVVSSRQTTYGLTVSIPPLAPEPFVEVLSPNGGEQWLEGETYNILWASAGVEQVDIAVASGGKDLGIIGSAVDAGSGQFTWLIPAGLISNVGVVKSDAMRLRVSDHDQPDRYDENDQPFSVLVPRIYFAPGTTSATVGGYVRRNSTYRYVLRALAGQVMSVTIDSPNDDVGLTISAEDGSVLKKWVDGQYRWNGTLHASQDYILEAVARNQDTSFQLAVTIPPLESEPTRIQFAPGATSVRLSGRVEQGSIDRYVFRALAEQTAEVVITSPTVNVALDLMGDDGTVLRHHTEGQRQWAGRLPSTQDYIISAVSVGPTTTYDLLLRIEPLATSPIRIQFQAGTTWATVNGDLGASGSRVYVLRALGGQHMDVSLLSPGSSVALSVWGADGEFLKWHGDGVPSWRGVLPATQDYYLEVITVAPSTYALTVEIPPL